MESVYRWLLRFKVLSLAHSPYRTRVFLLSERDKHLRLVAGVPDSATVDLSLVKLPPDALMFPSFAGRELDLTRLRDAHSVTQEFEKQARKHFPGLRFHDLRGSHETMLLDKGVPVH